MLDLSSIEESGEAIITTAATTAAAKVRPEWFTDDTQTAVNVFITATVTVAAAVLTAFLNRKKTPAK